jgi:hypothetical protein
MAPSSSHSELSYRHRRLAPKVLDFPGLKPPPDRAIVVRHRRHAEDLNSQWAARYLKEMPSD